MSVLASPADTYTPHALARRAAPGIGSSAWVDLFFSQGPLWYRLIRWAQRNRTVSPR